MDIYIPQGTEQKLSYFLFMYLSTVTFILATDPNEVQSHLKSDFQNDNLNFDLATMQDLLNDVGKTLDFYEKELDKLDADALLGLRVAEGALLTTIDNGYTKIFSNFDQPLKTLSSKAAIIATKLTTYVANSDPNYHPLLGNRWPIFKPFRQVKDIYSNSKKEVKGVDTKECKECFANLLTTKEADAEMCTISEDCWNLMTLKDLRGYNLTTQALYFLLAEVRGCDEELKQKLKDTGRKGGVHALQTDLCSAMYPQIMAIRRSGDHELNGDSIKLYFFQCFTCGLLGFEEYFMMDNLMDVMGWQFENGCFGDNLFAATEYKDNSKRDMEKQNVKLDNEDIVSEEDSLSNNQTYSKDKRSSPLMTRSESTEIKNSLNNKLQVGHDGYLEKKLLFGGLQSFVFVAIDGVLLNFKGGCVSRTTGHGLALMSLYVRWMLNFGKSKTVLAPDQTTRTQSFGWFTPVLLFSFVVFVAVFRRHFIRYIGVVASVLLLHQFRRVRNTSGLRV